MQCIFCDSANNAISIEHIISESFGNKFYVMEKGRVCDDCNARFSKFEDLALTNTVFVMERARLGVETKKGKNAKGKIAGLQIIGNENFEKNLVTVNGITEENFQFDPVTQTGKLVVKSFFDKSEVATSRLLLKIGLEGIFTSQKKMFSKYDFSELKSYLTNKSNIDWPFLTSDYEHTKFQSVPTFYAKYELSKLRCILKCCEVNDETLLLKFKYGAIPMTVNLLNRNLNWVNEYLEKDDKARLYPEHYVKKAKAILDEPRVVVKSQF